MKDARHLPPEIQWHEGMLLSPQHFQRLSARQEALLHYQHALALPYHWGLVREPTFDDSLLGGNGIFRVLELEAVMPDGTVVGHLPPDERLEIDLNGFVREGQRSTLTVHLAVPVQAPENGASRDGLPERFYSRESEPIRDESSGSAISMPLRMPRITLLADAHPSPQYSSFPLAKIRYENERFSPTDFIPPMLRVAEGSPIWRICDQVARLLREKAESLSEKMVADALNLETRFAIHGLVAGLPYFESVSQTGLAHPYQAYLALCLLMGNVALIDSEQIPPRFSTPYLHNDLRASFQRACGYIQRTVEGIFKSHEAIVFDFDPQTKVFSLYLRGEWLDAGQLAVGVRGKSGTGEREVIQWMERSLIASDSKMESVRGMKILGAPRAEMAESRELVPPKGVVLFAVKTDKGFILPQETLQIRNPSELSEAAVPAEIVLYVKRKDPLLGAGKEGSQDV